MLQRVVVYNVVPPIPVIGNIVRQNIQRGVGFEYIFPVINNPTRINASQVLL